MVVRKRPHFRFRQLGLVLTWLGIIALMIPGNETIPSPSLILLPLGVTLFFVGWVRRER